jgi:hypothetical protein
MAGFVPGRDRYTLEAMDPQDAERNNAAETAERRAILDKEELAELERTQTGGEPAPTPKRTLLDRLLRRR